MVCHATKVVIERPQLRQFHHGDGMLASVQYHRPTRYKGYLIDC